MWQVTEVPLKKVTAAQVIKNHYRALTVKINEKTYIGTEFYFLRKDLATSGYINKHKKLINRSELKDNMFEDLANIDIYRCGENNRYRFFDQKHTIIVLETDIGDIALNYNYYSYFKRRNLEFKFKGLIDLVGMFTQEGNEFAGVILPIRLPK